jgi:hypothetical protein
VILSLHMQYIKGTDRTQAVLFPQSLDEIIDPNNEVRIIDLFVESIDLAEFKFHLKGCAEGRPPYHPKDLEIENHTKNGFDVIIEPELLNGSGLIVTEGFLETPYRNDIILIKDNLPIESIIVDAQNKLSFDAITLQWSDSLEVTIDPFQWNYLTLEFADNDNLDWNHLKAWFNNSFMEVCVPFE